MTRLFITIYGIITGSLPAEFSRAGFNMYKATRLLSLLKHLHIMHYNYIKNIGGFTNVDSGYNVDCRPKSSQTDRHIR